MAVIKMELTCRECGKTFTHRRECHTRAEADGYEAWAKGNIDLCPDCRRKQQREARVAANVAMLAKYGMSLPAITEGTEKQVAYDNSLRADYIANSGDAESYCSVVATLRDQRERAEQQAAEQGRTLADVWAEYISRPQIHKIHTALTSTSAREIIDALK